MISQINSICSNLSSIDPEVSDLVKVSNSRFVILAFIAIPLSVQCPAEERSYLVKIVATQKDIKRIICCRSGQNSSFSAVLMGAISALR